MSMETNVDALVYQLEDDDINVRWNTLQKLRRIAAVETSRFPVRNIRRFLQCIRRRIVGESDPHVTLEALQLVDDVMVLLGDDVDQILSSILPHLIPILPTKSKNGKQDGDTNGLVQEEIFNIFQKYTNVANDLQAVADLLVNIGLASVHDSVREVSLMVLMRLLDERFQKRTITSREETPRRAIGRGDKVLIVALVQAIIPALEDSNENVIVSAEEAIAKLKLYWGDRFSSDVEKFLSSEDKRTLQNHEKPIAKFLEACTVSEVPLSSSLESSSIPESAGYLPSKVVHSLNSPDDLHFGFLKADTFITLTRNTSSSNADWKKRSAAVEILYAACKQVDVETLRGVTPAEHTNRMDELDELFGILIRLTQDVDVHMVKRALQITQILFRKLNIPHQLHVASDELPNRICTDTEEHHDSSSNTRSQRDVASYLTKMLAPLIETSANFAGEDEEMEVFVYALLGQLFESGCLSVNTIERVLTAFSLRHRRSQVREEALKVWIVFLLIAKRQGHFDANYAPNTDVIQTLGCLLGDTNTQVRSLTLEVIAVLKAICSCNVYTLLETRIDDEYIAKRIDWAALRARLRRKEIPDLRSNGTLQIRANSRPNRAAFLSVEQSLDGISELKMIPFDELSPFKTHRHDNQSVKSERISGRNLDDCCDQNQEKPTTDESTSCEVMSTGESPCAIDINEKLSALRKKMDQLRQPRSTRVRQSSSQQDVSPVKFQNSSEASEQMQSRSKSSPGESSNYLTHENTPTCRLNDSRKIATTKFEPNVFVSSARESAQKSPQRLQSLESDATASYEDRLANSKPCVRKRNFEANTLQRYPFSDDRPIAAAFNADQSDHKFEDLEYPRYEDNEMQSPSINNGKSVISLATRKRLEAKAKQEAQGNDSFSGHRILELKEQDNKQREPWQKSLEPKRITEADGVGTKAVKQELRYLEPHEVTPLLSPRQDLIEILSQLRSDNWEKVFDALSTVRRLMAHHANMIDTGRVHEILTEVMKQVQNLRSSVSKNALLALDSISASFSRVVDSELGSVIPVLLKRCGDSNAFVCESAAASLVTVVLKCSTSRIVSELGSHISSKAVSTRREVARSIHTLVVSHPNGIAASKELPLILQVIGRCLDDSSSEVREIAKQSVLYLHQNERMSEDHLKRFLTASAKTKVDSVLKGKAVYPSSDTYMHSEMRQVISEPSYSPLVTAKRDAVNRIKKSTRQLSIPSASAAVSSSGTRSKINVDELLRLETKLESNNWKDRFDALHEVTEFVSGCASTLVESGHMLNLFDLLIKRLDDSNAKVNVLALECMEKVVPAVGNGMEQVLPHFVPAVIKNLANVRTSSLAQSVVQQLCTHLDNRSLCQQFAIQARSANSRVIPALLDTLTTISASSLDDKNNFVLMRYVLPLALDLLEEAKSGVKQANAKLLRQLQQTLGSAVLLNAASKLSSTQQEKLAAILAIRC